MTKNQWLPTKIRRPREQLHEAVELIEAHEFTVAGSWRREKASVGDLDILVPPHLDFDQAVGEFGLMFQYEQARGGAMKSEGIAQWNNEPLLLNLWRVPEPKAWAGMLLFATGPYDLNIMMRARAKSKEWVLSQYGLFKVGGQAPETQLDNGQNEESIFELLKLPFIRPVDRDEWKTHVHGTTPQKQHQVVMVRSSNGVDQYMVTLEDGKATECECKGFQYRSQCRHLAEAEAKTL